MKNWFEKKSKSHIFFCTGLDGVKGGLIIILESRPIQNEIDYSKVTSSLSIQNTILLKKRIGGVAFNSVIWPVVTFR
jgi:hypothetical protein